jgi:hypothetical protein
LENETDFQASECGEFIVAERVEGVAIEVSLA